MAERLYLIDDNNNVQIIEKQPYLNEDVLQRLLARILDLQTMRAGRLEGAPRRTSFEA